MMCLIKNDHNVHANSSVYELQFQLMCFSFLLNLQSAISLLSPLQITVKEYSKGAYLQLQSISVLLWVS